MFLPGRGVYTLLFLLSLVLSAPAISGNDNSLEKRSAAVYQCNGADQVVINELYGYWSGTKTTANQQAVLTALNSYKSWLTQFPSRQGFKYESGNIAGYMWVGSMVQNSGFAATAIEVFINEVQTYGIPNSGYLEYITGDPMTSFGIGFDTSDQLVNMQSAGRKWSEGKSFATTTGSKMYNNQLICFLEYANRKPVQNDNEAGPCDYILVTSGMDLETATGVNGESLEGYNPSLNFNALQVGQAVCYSIGTPPDLGGPQEITINEVYGYWSGTKTTANQQAVLTALNTYKSLLNQYPSRQGFKYESGNIAGYMWVGSMIQNSGFANTAIEVFINEVQTYGIPNSGYLEYITGDPMTSFGIGFDTGDQLGNMQRAGRKWSEGKSFATTTGSKMYNNEKIYVLDYASRKPVQNDADAGVCDYILVTSGINLESATGISAESLEGYNPGLDFSSLQVGQPVCYSIGTAPNSMPQQNSDGSCYSYTIKSGDSCSSIVAKYSPITVANIDTYNEQTFGWYGCDNGHPNPGDIICLSSGTPPKPAVNQDAQCGPQAPGSLYNSECPLNACCSSAGYCGFTSDYCEVVKSPTGAPGTSGCISNCGVPALPTTAVSTFNNKIYWMNSDNSALAMNPTDLDDGTYGSIHYAYGALTTDISTISDSTVNADFKKIVHSKKVMSFGGWDFSTDTATYSVFRNAVSTAGNRDTFANTLIGFMKRNGFNGIDLDWEYPGEQDIPGIPADTANDGANLLSFLQLLKSRMPSGTTVSLAIPASYWYLKGFPLSQMQQYVDYFVYMTYDLHSQADYASNNHVMCHTNQTEIVSALQMLVGAGVNLSKVYGGLANYARTFKLANKSCTAVGCAFTGPDSGANPGDITQTAGVLAESELLAIAASSRKNSRWTDAASLCDIMVYDGDNWAAWTKQANRDVLSSFFRQHGLAGTITWTANYDTHKSYTP